MLTPSYRALKHYALTSAPNAKFKLGYFLSVSSKKIETKCSWGQRLYIPALSNKLQMTLLLLKYMSQVVLMQEETSQSSSGTAITKIYAFPQVVSF